MNIFETVNITNINFHYWDRYKNFIKNIQNRGRNMNICEYMEKEDYDEVIEPGDVVCFTDNGKITKVKNTEDTLRVAGVVSSEDSAGLILGGDALDEHQKVLIGLAGRIWVKVNCPVRTGNLLRVMSDGTVEVTNTLDRFVIGKATKPSEDGKVYMKIIN